MSSIAAGTSTLTALVASGNTDGTLQLQVNGTTPALTLNTSGAVGVGSTPGYGTSGQVLTSAGSAAAPTWTTIASSPTVLLSTATANNSASINFTSLISSTYNNYSFSVVNLLPATDNVSIGFQTSTDNGATWDTGSVYFGSGGGAQGPSNLFVAQANSAPGASGQWVLMNAGSSSATNPAFFGRMFILINNASILLPTLGSPATLGSRAAAVNAVRFIPSSGNITSGTIRMYGWN